MKVYSASYNWHGSSGWFKDAEYIVIANTKEEALGLALEAEAETDAADWTITEIDTTVPFAHYISSHEN